MSRRRSKIDGLEEAHRVQTEVEEQRNKEERYKKLRDKGIDCYREILSRAHKLKQSLGQEDMKQMMKPPLNGLQVNKTPKELGSTQKITKVQENYHIQVTNDFAARGTDYDVKK